MDVLGHEEKVYVFWNASYLNQVVNQVEDEEISNCLFIRGDLMARNREKETL